MSHCFDERCEIFVFCFIWNIHNYKIALCHISNKISFPFQELLVIMAKIYMCFLNPFFSKWARFNMPTTTNCIWCYIWSIVLLIDASFTYRCIQSWRSTFSYFHPLFTYLSSFIVLYFLYNIFSCRPYTAWIVLKWTTFIGMRGRFLHLEKDFLI